MRRFIVLSLSCCLLAVVTAEARDPVARRAENRQARQPAATVEGTLRRNTEARAGDAPYALLDSTGRVACLVTPQSGLKLSQHVGRHVRLDGVKQSRPGQAAPMFSAQAIRPVLKDDALADEYAEETDEPIGPVSFEEESDESQIAGMPGEPYYDGPDQQGLAYGDPNSRQPNVGGWYLRAEYLYWWSDGMYAPALVTTSPNGTARANAGVIGPPGTTILFGQESLNNNGISGARINVGKWLECYPGHAIEGDYWGLGTQNSGFFANSTGDPILARPFFDINQATESAQLVAFPNVLTGSVLVDPITYVQGAVLRKRWQLCGCLDCDPCDPCCCTGWSYDVTAGYRFMRLDDTLRIRENLVSTDTSNPGSFVVQDQFRTKNMFNGAEVGTIMGGRNGRWSYELLGRVALGTTFSTVNINGFTDITPVGGPTTRSTGGLFTQRTNIGSYSRNEFAMIPELGATGGVQLNSVWRLTFGYSLIYWSNVVRAGQQIDRDVNTNLLPPEAVPFSGNLRPRFVFNDTDFWVQGVNVGLDARW